MNDPRTVLLQLLDTVRSAPWDGDVTITGRDPVLPSHYLLGTAAAATIAATGVAAAHLWELRSGLRQRISVDMRAAAAALRSDRYLHVDGRLWPREWGPISGFYRTADDRWVQLHCNFPHHQDGCLQLLACDNDRGAVAREVARWNGGALEEAMAEAGLCAGLVRNRDEWEQHPQARAAEKPALLEILRIGESPAESLKPGDRPLSGVRAVDMTHVIAGPVGARTLAEHGADVLRIGAPQLPGIPHLLIDTGHGKLSTHLDLNREDDFDKLLNLLHQADIFIQSYRPGALDCRGLSPQRLAMHRPGIIYVTLSAYGHEGPWKGRRGFDTLVQSVTGMVREESGPDHPRHIAAQALDYCSGYLMALGAMVALGRRMREGGSYLVRVSLCRTALWLHRLGRLDKGIDGRKHPDLPVSAIEDLLIETDTPFGRLKHIGPVLQLSETPPRWTRPSVPLGTHPPVWP